MKQLFNVTMFHQIALESELNLSVSHIFICHVVAPHYFCVWMQKKMRQWASNFIMALGFFFFSFWYCFVLSIFMSRWTGWNTICSLDVCATSFLAFTIYAILFSSLFVGWEIFTLTTYCLFCLFWLFMCLVFRILIYFIFFYAPSTQFLTPVAPINVYCYCWLSVPW